MSVSTSALTGAIPKSAKIAFTAAVMGLVAACTSTSGVNHHLVKQENSEGLNTVQQLAALKKGQHSQSIRHLLGNPDNRKFDEMVGTSRDMGDIKAAYYGSVEIKGTPEEMDAHRAKIEDYTVWAVPFKYVEKEWSIGKGTYDIESSGTQGKIVFILDQDGFLVTDAKPDIDPASGVDKEAFVPKMLEGIIGSAPAAGVKIGTGGMLP